MKESNGDRRRQPRIEGWIGNETVGQVVLQVVVNPEAGPHRPRSRAGRIPGQANPRLPKRYGVILSQTRGADRRICLDDPVWVKDIIGAAAGRFIPPRGHLIPQSQAQGEIRFELDFILNVPGRFRRAVAKRSWIRGRLKLVSENPGEMPVKVG